MALAIENLRLKELAAVAALNKPMFDWFVSYLRSAGYSDLHAFVIDKNGERAGATIAGFLREGLPNGVILYDGIARPYSPEKSRWLLLGWILRDAPEQRLRPMIASMVGRTTVEKQAILLNKVREYVAEIFPDENRWEWSAISEVMIDRLEGSRRAIKGSLFEAIVRRLLSELFDLSGLKLRVDDAEIKLHGETYDVSVVGANGQILIPVKTRETMGGGHAGIFTRDIHKSIHAATEAGFECLPIIIAESWIADLSSLECKDQIYIDRNPNQIKEVEPILAAELERRLGTFKSII